MGQAADAFKNQFGPLPGRLQKLYTSDQPTASQSTLLIGFGYDEAGRLNRVLDPEGDALEYSWDDANRIAGWRDRLGLDYHYTYDDRGRVVHGQGNHGFLTASFEYHENPGPRSESRRVGGRVRGSGRRRIVAADSR